MYYERVLKKELLVVLKNKKNKTQMQKEITSKFCDSH